ncbi:MAG TPA: HAMP domain-containing protein [Ideonella sp.]|nr:HAMP domain-containing protein [Ideonella sp.]
MRLKNRLALVVVLFMSAFVACYSLLLLVEVPERADAETAGSLPWVLSLLPDRVDSSPRGEGEPLQRLVELVHGLDKIRHVWVALRTPDGALVVGTPSRARQLPGWLSARLSSPQPPARKDVMEGGRVVAYFEVGPATGDELAELWEDFIRSTLLVVGLSLVAMVLIVWFTFRALKPLDRIRDALRAVAAGRQNARLPVFRNPEMDEIAMSFNRMADAQAASNAERQTLLRKLIDSDENTRRSVAHDLHDELSPYLVALQPLVRTLQIKCAKRPELEDIAATVDTLIDHQTHILAKLRAILMGLHPPELDTLGLRGALERMAAQPLHTEAGQRIEVNFHAGGDWLGFGPTVDVSVYRLVQECLTNVRRHSAGTRVDIVFDPAARLQGRAAIGIEVVNDCRAGAAPAGGGGLGVPGMRDRCVALGGSFEAGAVDARAWRVRIRLPLDTAAPPQNRA